ncbi:MAG: hydroxymethylglutaryl-CoA lyase [Salinarimonas sp.]|nr:hydroxymethylglutaryl-CoA lyase [Salinarimonas sp.]
MREAIRFVEVGPRDGLQNLAAPVSTALKARLCEKLFAAGVCRLECASFVSPAHVPQMADAEALLAAISPPDGAELDALAPNARGALRAVATRADRISVFVAATQSFAQRNTRCSIEQCLERAGEVRKIASGAGRQTRGYVSCIADCPYEGLVPTRAVMHVARALIHAGFDEIALGDTIGSTSPADMRRLLRALKQEIPVARLAVHCHDTYGMAAASTLAAIEEGVRIVDGAVAGLGGCPFAPGAAGNAASEDLVFMLEGLGFDTGIDCLALAETGRWLTRELGLSNASRTGPALLARPITARPAEF